MRLKLADQLNLFTTYLFAALLFFVPLVLLPSTFEVFEFNKMMLTYVLTSFIVGTTLAQWVLNKKVIIPRTPLDLFIFAFLASQIASTVFSINPHTSFWGYYSRFHGGLASTITYTLLFYTLILNLGTNKDKKLKILFASLLSSATIIALYGVLEHFGIDKNLWVQDVQNRVFSTLGQPNWLSAYLIALLPLPLYKAISANKTKSFILWTTTSLIILSSIIFTKSQSGIGTTAIILLLFFAYQLKPKSKTKKKNLSLAFTATILTILIFGTPWSPSLSQLTTRFQNGGALLAEIEPHLNKLGISTTIKQPDRSKPTPQSLAQSKAADEGRRYGGSSSWDIRKTVWKGAIRLFKQKPILGTGVETFGYAYYWVKPQEHNLLSEWDFLYNKAHNEYLNYLATTGLFGTLTYFALTLSILVLLFKNHLKEKQTHFPLLLGFLSILITNYFGFSVVIIGIFFYLFPAISISISELDRDFSWGSGWRLTKKEKKALQKKNTSPKVGITQYFLLTLITLGTISITVTISKHWLADIHYNRGKNLNDLGQVSRATLELEKATKLYPQEPQFHAELGEAYANTTLAIKQQFDSYSNEDAAAIQTAYQDKITDLKDKSITSINTALTLNPWHINYHKSKASAELALAQIDPNYYQTALTTLLKTNELAPTDAKIIYNIGLIYETLGQNDKAITAFQKAVELKPDYEGPLSQLVALLDQKGDPEAKSYLQDLIFYSQNPAYAENYPHLLQ